MALDEHIWSLIARYDDGVSRVETALAGITDDELDCRDGEEWSARMVVHHLADSETNSYVRLRRLLGEPSGTAIAGYDEARWATTPALGYESDPIDLSLQVFKAVRASSSRVLHRLEPSDFEREGVHSESGPYRLIDWLNIYAQHALEHAEQIERARTTRSA